MAGFQKLAGLLAMGLPDKDGHCDQHGVFVSRHLVGRAWSSCPQCQVDAKAERDRVEREAAARKRQQAWEASVGRAGIPLRFRDRSFESYRVESEGQSHALAFSQAYADGFDSVVRSGRSALFCGAPGTGKTHLACAIAMQLLATGRHTAAFMTVTRLVRSVRETWRGGVLRESEAIALLVAPDLLVLDEVGAQVGSESEQLILFDVLNERYEQRKPVILLSNLAPAGVKQCVGDRVWDRLREGGGEVVVFDWESGRGEVECVA